MDYLGVLRGGGGGGMPSSWCWQNCLAHNGSYTASLSWPWAVHVGAGLGSPTLSPQKPRAQSPAGFATLRSRLHASYWKPRKDLWAVMTQSASLRQDS